ncbi:MAG: hypothetical protein E6R03_17715 [Hyphomicrobiaceae bacterium]|nr:MAG: hypothetical protein E6R03_17715 [Hyphomicrobiaceae bacterium]
METTINPDAQKGISDMIESLAPALTGVIRDRNFAVVVRRTGPNSFEVVKGNEPYPISDDLLEQMNMMVNISTIMDVKGPK